MAQMIRNLFLWTKFRVARIAVPLGVGGGSWQLAASSSVDLDSGHFHTLVLYSTAQADVGEVRRGNGRRRIGSGPVSEIELYVVTGDLKGLDAGV